MKQLNIKFIFLKPFLTPAQFKELKFHDKLDFTIFSRKLFNILQRTVCILILIKKLSVLDFLGKKQGLT